MGKVALDNLYSHSKNVGTEPKGYFCGTPIVDLNEHSMDLDREVEINRVIENSKLYNDTAEENTTEKNSSTLPGESVCKDNIVRRGTSAEILSGDFKGFPLYMWRKWAGSTNKQLLNEKAYNSEGSYVGLRIKATVDGSVIFSEVFSEHSTDMEELAQTTYQSVVEKLWPIYPNYEVPSDAKRVTLAEGQELVEAGELVEYRPDRVVGPEEFAIVYGN